MGSVDWSAIGIWVEAIALVAIFIWDRIDASRDHDETLKQIKLVQDQINISQNAERAWIMTGLLWTSDYLHVVTQTSGGNAGEGSLDTTTIAAYLWCKNEGRSPAFVDSIQGYAELVEKRLGDLPPPAGHKTQSFPPIGPIAPGKEEKKEIHLTCEGHPRKAQLISIFVLVKYRDIFGQKRVTTCGYTVSDNYLTRQDQFPERNYIT
jgi:hypothetical protein